MGREELCPELHCISPKDMYTSRPPAPVTMILLGNRVSAVVINLRISRRYHPEFQVGPKSNDWCLYERNRGGI